VDERGTKANVKGTFKLGRIPGAYKFKVIMNVFQSVVRNLVVSPKANKADPIEDRDESRYLM